MARVTQTTPLSFPPGLATNAPTQSNVLCDENEIIAKKISSSLFIVMISFGTGSKLESVTLLRFFADHEIQLNNF